MHWIIDLCCTGRLFISDEKIVFLHSQSAAVILPLSCLDSLQFYDGVSDMTQFYIYH